MLFTIAENEGEYCSFQSQKQMSGFQLQFYMNKICWQIINQSEVKKNSVA